MKLLIKKLLGLAPKMPNPINIPKEEHGTGYGSWVISKSSLSKNSNIFSFGIGKDITFDLSIIQKYNAVIYEFDPTPEVSDWLYSQELPTNFKYYPIALASVDGETRFFKPLKEGHISHSVSQDNSQQEFVDVPCCKLSTLMLDKNITYLDLLKMDIEGFEYDVIDDFIESNCAINQLLIEFHHGLYGKKVEDTENAIRKIISNGYSIFNISSSGREVSFIKNSLLN